MENQSPAFGYNVLRVFDSVFFVEEAFNSNADEAQIGYALGLHTNIEESWIQYNIRVDFSTKDNKVFATGTVVTKFGIDNLKQFMKGDGLIWPENVLEVMFGMAFSHTRALMAKNMAPTQFSNFMVPIINPKEVFKKLMETQPGFEQINQDEAEEPTQIDEANRKRTDDLYDELPNKSSEENISKIKKKHAK